MTDTQGTYLVMAVATAVLIAWDVKVALNDTLNQYDTESGIMRRLGRIISGVPFLWGILGGHFWGPSLSSFLPGIWPIVASLVSAFALSGLHFLLMKFVRFPIWIGLLYFLLGIPVGIFVWPQGG